MSTSATSLPSSARANTSEAASSGSRQFDADLRWELHPRVALRPEPFGAMAYHYDNRRLNFLRSFPLVDLVKTLADHPSARDAFDASDIDARRWPSYERALASLAASDFLQPLTDTDTDTDSVKGDQATS